MQLNEGWKRQSEREKTGANWTKNTTKYNENGEPTNERITEDGNDDECMCTT